MGLSDQNIDIAFMLDNERLDVGVVDEPGALGLGKDEIGEEEEAEPGVEGKPANDEDGPRLDQEERGENNPVEEPGGQLGGVGGAERFVGGIDGKEDGGYGARGRSDTTRSRGLDQRTLLGLR
jgi:hypothetical protein